MGAVVVIGEPELVDGYALAGAIVVTAQGPEQVRRAWQELPASVSLVILTDSAAQLLADDMRDAAVLTAVMPT